MSITLEDLIKRVDQLEREVKELKEIVAADEPEDTPFGRVREMLRRPKANRAARMRAADRIMKQIGATDSSISIEELHQRMIADGIRPEDNIGSRGIIEMREE
jgi:hypothetical protein